jgi:hypothetical protein
MDTSTDGEQLCYKIVFSSSAVDSEPQRILVPLFTGWSIARAQLGKLRIRSDW